MRIAEGRSCIPRTPFVHCHASIRLQTHRKAMVHPASFHGYQTGRLRRIASRTRYDSNVLRVSYLRRCRWWQDAQVYSGLRPLATRLSGHLACSGKTGKRPSSSAWTCVNPYFSNMAMIDVTVCAAWKWPALLTEPRSSFCTVSPATL